MVDWKSMTPEQVLEALMSAPKVAGPRSETGWRTAYGTTRPIAYDLEPEEEDARLSRDGWLIVDTLPRRPAETTGNG